ncbi:Magnesium/proton exchanger 1 [Zea mays]|uniref:Magnesium/proton exchanger 1 n=2 Tax=Zea mays TaxID=4577 RepID=A0A3L6DNY9_MAIZE|nr:Magnesium/proton exchanger 1 [Zea mays]
MAAAVARRLLSHRASSSSLSMVQAIWDKTLEMRFLLQKAFSTSNKLPQEPIRTRFCNHDKQIEQAYDDLLNSARGERPEDWVPPEDVSAVYYAKCDDIDETLPMGADGNDGIVDIFSAHSYYDAAGHNCDESFYYLFYGKKIEIYESQRNDISFPFIL